MRYCFGDESSDLCLKKGYYFKNSIMSLSLWEVENATEMTVCDLAFQEELNKFYETCGFSMYSSNMFKPYSVKALIQQLVVIADMAQYSLSLLACTMVFTFLVWM